MLQQLRGRLQVYAPRPLISGDAANSLQASVLIAVTDQIQPELIFTLRSQSVSTHSGEVSFPGGKRDAGDVDLLQTALREAEEEIALPPSKVEVLGQLPPVIARSGMSVTSYIGIVPSQLELVANEYEIESIFRVPLQYLLDHANDRVDEINFLGRPLFIPHYVYEGYDIWGLSSLMLSELLNVAFDADIQLERSV